jgi:hypothetical protein
LDCRRWAFVATKPAVNLYAWVMRTTPNDQATDRQAIVSFGSRIGSKPLIAFLQTKPDHIRVRPFPTGVYEGTGSTLVGSPIYDPSRSARPAAF